VDESVTITIGKAEALVLFDLLAGFRDGLHLPIRNDAERVTLWMIEACLEKALVEPFSAEYERILEEAREKVVARWGSPPKSPNTRTS
jgi:hypothetical protein